MLDRMVVAYDRGLLVPFIGAGMSTPACHLWEDFVAGLESQAGPAFTGDLVHRAARAVRKIRFGSRTALHGAVVAALSDMPKDPPPQTKALASVFWPLVVTTNYDDLYVAAVHDAYVESHPSLKAGDRREPPVLLLGRRPAHCQRVLISLRQPEVPLLWALQGFVGGQAKPLQSQEKVHPGRATYRDHFDTGASEETEYFADRWKPLEDELVVGHAEYRRVAMRSESFRRAFAELYRSRSLLFLGSGLRDQYFLDLFSEIIELYGPSPHPHYAFLTTEESDPEFLRQYFGIWVDPLSDYCELPDRLEELKEMIEGPRERQTVWHFCRASTSSSGSPAGEGGLRIIRGDVPTDLADDECVVVSAGGPGGLQLSPVGEEILGRLRCEKAAFERLRSLEDQTLPLWRHRKDSRLLAVTARLEPWKEVGASIRPTDPTKKPIGTDEPVERGWRMARDIRIISLAAREVMHGVQSLEYRRVHSMLLAAGPLRTFAQSHALLQMARGWATWRREATGHLSDLSIYLTAREEPDVLYDLDAGRLDLARNLVPTTLEFWLEIHKNEGGTNTQEPELLRSTEVERYLQVERSDRPLRDVLSAFDIGGDDWELDLLPRPCLNWGNWTLRGVATWEDRHAPRRLSLETFGLLPGSTLKVFEPLVKRVAE